MAMSNELNRPQHGVNLALGADATTRILHTHKALILRGVSIVLAAAQALHATNFQEMQLVDIDEAGNSTNIGDALSHETAGLPIGATPFTGLDDYILAAGHTLGLTNDQNGNGTLAIMLSVDYEVRGN